MDEGNKLSRLKVSYYDTLKKLTDYQKEMQELQVTLQKLDKAIAEEVSKESGING